MRVVWLRRALFDLESIEKFIEHDNLPAAREMQQRIGRAVSLLADQPGMGRIGRVPRTRELVISGTPYIVAYTATVSEVIVLAVMHGARKWPDSF